MATVALPLAVGTCTIYTVDRPQALEYLEGHAQHLNLATFKLELEVLKAFKCWNILNPAAHWPMYIYIRRLIDVYVVDGSTFCQ